MSDIPYGYFFHLNNPFCEGRHLGQHNIFSNRHETTTEIGNTISNAAYIIFGALCFNMVYNVDSLMRVCCALLVTTGIASGLYHATFLYGFGFLDGMAMGILVIFLMSALIEDILTVVMNRDSRMFKFVICTFESLWACWLMFVLQQKALADSWTLGDSELIGVSVLILGCGLIIVFVNHPERDARILIIVAFASFGFAYFCRELDDIICRYETAWIFLHAWWHVFSAYSCSCIITLVIYVRSGMYGYFACIEWRWKIYPICVLSFCPKSPTPQPYEGLLVIHNPRIRLRECASPVPSECMSPKTIECTSPIH